MRFVALAVATAAALTCPLEHRALADDDALDVDVLPPQPEPISLARPIIALDDTRTHGPTARDYVDLGITPTILSSGGGTVFETAAQVTFGLPYADLREVRELYEAYHLLDYQLRVRGELFGSSNSWDGGPITIGVQRYFAIDSLAISPLVDAHVGIELALSTPWVSGRYLTPPATVRAVDAVDTELARDGWSVRPASAYFRADFLACRSAAFDFGIEPEVFEPSTGATEYDLRFHAEGGWSFGCHGKVSPHAPKLSLEYRGRARLHAQDEAPGYKESFGAGFQIDCAWFVVQLFYRTDPSALVHDRAIGLRLQFGRER